jgi:hypothetical protein
MGGASQLCDSTKKKCLIKSFQSALASALIKHLAIVTHRTNAIGGDIKDFPATR